MIKTTEMQLACIRSDVKFIAIFLEKFVRVPKSPKRNALNYTTFDMTKLFYICNSCQAKIIKEFEYSSKLLKFQSGSVIFCSTQMVTAFQTLWA